MSATPPVPPAADPAAQPGADDPHLWLEEVEGPQALDWVRQRNAASRAVLERHPRFAAMRDGFRAILDAKDRIPEVRRRGDHLYNFWRDGGQPRGLWRRTTLAQYRRPDTAWDTLLDLDALAKAEGENWVWAGAQVLGPAHRRALVSLSRGGADATVVREYDLEARAFVKDGFTLPEAKSRVEWLNADELLVGTDTGPGSMTDSGYPRQVRRWKRGTPLAEAPVVFEGQPGDVSAWSSVDRTPGFERVLVGRATDFYNQQAFLLTEGGLKRLDLPSDADPAFWKRHLLLQLRSDWAVGGRRFAAGSLLVTEAEAFLAKGAEAAAWQPLFTPAPGRSLAGYTLTRGQVVLELLEHVAGKLEAWRLVDGRWQGRPVPAPFPGTLSAAALHDPLVGDADPLAEQLLLSYTDFLTPDELLLADLDPAATPAERHPRLKSRPAYFDASGMRVEQHFATSKDGTRVPYFVVWPKDARADGDNPTLLYGYGGFEVSQQPWYSAGFGTAWYRHGGVLVVANIRGGGEYGPAWHQAAVKANKQKSYDDFIAVAEDLIARRITRPARLGIEGGSNGGLLVGAVMVQRPELFGAVVCQVPLLDMRRFHKLLAGASWMAEYGDPDKPEDWAVIGRYSPYQNVRPASAVTMPPVLFVTSTRDDRVHPGHARKMAARMTEQGHRVLYYENIEGGHGAAADNAQKADMMALEFAFLWQQLGAGR